MHSKRCNNYYIYYILCPSHIYTGVLHRTINRCWDYVEIIREAGSIEECGDTPSRFSVGDIENGQLTVVFRTNRNENTDKDGFVMYVKCYKPAETNQEGEYCHCCMLLSGVGMPVRLRGPESFHHHYIT